MGKTYRKTTGVNWDQSLGKMVSWEEVVEIETDPIKAELRQVQRQSERRQAKIKATAAEVKKLQEQFQDIAYYHYDEIRPEMVDPIVRKGAEAALGYFSKRIGTYWPVKLKWFTQQTFREREQLRELGALECVEVHSFDHPVWGFTKLFGETIWIKAGIGFWNTLTAIAHELVHTKQWGGYLTPTQHPQASWRNKAMPALRR